jgi:hypothetical protein
LKGRVGRVFREILKKSSVSSLNVGGDDLTTSYSRGKRSVVLIPHELSDLGARNGYNFIRTLLFEAKEVAFLQLIVGSSSAGGG